MTDMTYVRVTRKDRLCGLTMVARTYSFIAHTAYIPKDRLCGQTVVCVDRFIDQDREDTNIGF